MARKPTGNPTGRPQCEIDWKLFEDLCGLLCTQSEIASTLGVHNDTLRDRVLEEYGEDYSSTYKKYCETGKCSLRRNQVVLSKKNASMAIWLGKQWLGQKDHDDDDRRSKSPNDELLDTQKQLIKSQYDLMILRGQLNQDVPKIQISNGI